MLKQIIKDLLIMLLLSIVVSAISIFIAYLISLKPSMKFGDVTLYTSISVCLIGMMMCVNGIPSGESLSGRGSNLISSVFSNLESVKNHYESPDHEKKFKKISIVEVSSIGILLMLGGFITLFLSIVCF